MKKIYLTTYLFPLILSLKANFLIRIEHEVIKNTFIVKIYNNYQGGH